MRISSHTASKVVGSLVIIVAFSPFLRAQPPGQETSAASAPSSAPATQPAPRKVVLPPGFKTVTINGRTVACEPVDEGWITTALLKISSTTQPATLPATLLQRLTDQRDALLHRIATDLAASDTSEIAKLYDHNLIEPIREMDHYRPKVIYLACGPDQLVQLMRNGWNDPHFYYNRAADAVSFTPAGSLPIDRPQDEALFPAAFNPKDPIEKREEALKVAVRSIEASIQASIEVRARTHVGATFALIVQQVGMAPLKLREDQTWFAMGTATYLSVLYTAGVLDADRGKMLDLFSNDTRGNPLKASTIDLLHPQDMKQMRQQAIPLYFDAYRRKSTQAIRSLAEKGGESAIPKSIAAIREKKPADGAALVQVIKGATGVDLQPMMGSAD
jgi:hypothetical protein